MGPILTCNQNETQVSVTVHPGVYVWSFYCQARNGITPDFYLLLDKAVQYT